MNIHFCIILSVLFFDVAIGVDRRKPNDDKKKQPEKKDKQPETRHRYESFDTLLNADGYIPKPGLNPVRRDRQSEVSPSRQSFIDSRSWDRRPEPSSNPWEREPDHGPSPWDRPSEPGPSRPLERQSFGPGGLSSRMRIHTLESSPNRRERQSSGSSSGSSYIRPLNLDSPDSSPDRRSGNQYVDFEADEIWYNKQWKKDAEKRDNPINRPQNLRTQSSGGNEHIFR